MTTMSMRGLATAGFAGELEDGDYQAQLVWYAEDAQLSVVNWGRSTENPRLLLGKPAIADWISRTFSDNQSVRVVYDVHHDEEITIIAECRKDDGTLCIYSCTAQLQGGLIVRQHVVLL
jgi:hypothetical protein